MNADHWLKDAVKQGVHTIPGVIGVIVVVLLFLQSADAKQDTLVTALNGFGSRIDEIHSEMLRTHDECHDMQNKMIAVTVQAGKALEHQMTALAEQTVLLRELTREIRKEHQ